jgi:hypothetical protein
LGKNGEVTAILLEVYDEAEGKLEMNGRVYHRLRLGLRPTEVPRGELLWENAEGTWQRVEPKYRIEIRVHVPFDR